MSFLFDYQINYYSDSKNRTQLPFSAFALTQQGLEHQKINIGNQDSGSLYLGKRVMIGALADGCTSGKNLNGKSHNQVGAYIGSYLTVRLIRKLVIKKRVSLELLIPAFEQELIYNYKKLLNTLNPWKFERNEVIENLFLSTLIFFMITDKKYLIANCGDGDIIINGKAQDLDKNSGNYFASNLIDIHRLENGKYPIKPNLNFQIVSQGKIDALDSLFIATDGFLDPDIKQHDMFKTFFLNGIGENDSNGFLDRRSKFRKDFLTSIIEMKNGRIWPHDDATFISIKRVAS